MKSIPSNRAEWKKHPSDHRKAGRFCHDEYTGVLCRVFVGHRAGRIGLAKPVSGPYFEKAVKYQTEFLMAHQGLAAAAQ